MTHPIRPSAKFSLAALAMVAALSVGLPTAKAGLVDLNPTGSSSTPTMQIAGIDLAPGNALARSSLPLVPGSTFQLYYQASVSGFIDKNGFTSTPTGLGSTYQITAVASFTEVVRSVTAAGTMASFSLAPVQSVNSFFELYYNPTVVANNLAGTGFNAGTLILSATASTNLANVGSYSLTTDAKGNPAIQPLDQYLTNHYPGVSTTVGSGSALVTAQVATTNAAFFKSTPTALTFNSSLVTPFSQTSPSARFLSHAGAGNPDITPDLGTVNGLNGRDFQFQADANFSFGAVAGAAAGAVPEPPSIVMSAMGLVAVLGGYAWKTARSGKASARTVVA